MAWTREEMERELPIRNNALYDALLRGEGWAFVNADNNVRWIGVEEMRERYPASPAEPEQSGRAIVERQRMGMEKLAPAMKKMAADYERQLAQMFYEGSQWPAPDRMHMVIPDRIARRAERAMFDFSVCPPYEPAGFPDTYDIPWSRWHVEQCWTLHRVRRTAGR